MKKVLKVIRQELYITFKRPSYIILAFGIPFMAAAILFGVKFINQRNAESSDTASGSSESSGEEFQFETEGYLDLSGLIKTIPENNPEYPLIQYQSESEIQQALDDGEISAYYIIPEDYITTGEVAYIYPNSRSFLEDGQKWMMSFVLITNILEGDIELANHIWNPIWNLERESITPQVQAAEQNGDDCSRPGVACRSNDLIRYMPAIMVAIFYMIFMTSSSMIFNSIATEKENRTIEVLMMSISPKQLLTGKTIALGLAGLLQVTIWLVAVWGMITAGGTTLKLPENFVFPTDIVVWGIILFIGGYGVYGSLMAGAGILVPKVKEAGAANFIAMIPLIIGYLVGLFAPIAEATNSLLPVALSYFPLTSPVVMIMRMTDSTVPLYQLLIAAVLLYLTAYLTLQTAAGMFHAKNLLSSEAFSTKRFFKGIFGLA